MNTRAFTLIEVLMAMSIMTSCLFVIANLQSRALNKVLFERDKIEHTFLLKRDAYAGFVEPPEDGKKTVNRMEEPEVTLTTQTADVQPKSVLKEWKDYIKMLRTEAAWNKDGVAHEAVMTSIVFKRAKKEEKK
jgi:prepilin-type N-terminal cleavage/methylation domain-containing protein